MHRPNRFAELECIPLNEMIDKDRNIQLPFAKRGKHDPNAELVHVSHCGSWVACGDHPSCAGKRETEHVRRKLVHVVEEKRTAFCSIQTFCDLSLKKTFRPTCATHLFKRL